MPLKAARKYTIVVSGAKDQSENANAMQGTHQFSFSIKTPERVHWYTIKKGDGTGPDALKRIASRPETYDDASKWAWILEANQDDNLIDRFSARAGLRVVIPWWE